MYVPYFSTNFNGHILRSDIWQIILDMEAEIHAGIRLVRYVYKIPSTTEMTCVFRKKFTSVKFHKNPFRTSHGVT